MKGAVALAFLSMSACSKDEKKVEEVVKADAGAASVDAAAPQEVPLSPYDLLKSLPKTPPAFKGEPGTSLEAPRKTNRSNLTLQPQVADRQRALTCISDDHLSAQP